MNIRTIFFSMIISLVIFLNVASLAKSPRAKAVDQIMDDSVLVEKIFFSNTPPNDNNEIYMMNPDGSGLQRLTNHAGRDCGPELSPNMKKIAFYVHAPGNEYSWSEHIMNADGSNITRLTNTPDVCDGDPKWSPDGKQITFGRAYPQENFREEIWIMNADGSHLHRVGTFGGGGPDWSPEGNKIVFASKINTSYHICVADTDGSNFQQLTNIGTENWWPSYSPEGDKIVFQSNRDGNHEIYVMSANGANPVRLTNNPAEESDPCWSPDGKRIAFLSFRDGRYNIYSMNANNGANQTRLTTMQTHNIQPDWRTLRAPLKKYLGQAPPDTIPVRFGPAYLISDGSWGWHGSPQFSPDGKEMFFVKYHFNLLSGNAKIYQMKIVNGEWTSPTRPGFASDSTENSPVYSMDGNTLYFLSFRDGSAKIYRVTRAEDSWSPPQLVNLAYQSLPGIPGWCFSMIRDSILYLEVSTQGQGDIYRSPLVNGQFSQFEKLPEPINSTFDEGAPYVDPDERFIIFISKRPGGYGYHDLYISFKKSDGTWTAAQNMGHRINGSNEDFMASISPDGKYLFFNSAKAGDRAYNAYWVDAQLIEKFNPQTDVPNGMGNIPAEFHLYQNYPNPFNPTTTIPFDLKNRAQTRLEIYNVFGTMVSILVNEEKASGRYAIEWNGKDDRGHPVSSGLYFYRLTCGVFSQTQKAILLK